LATSSAGLYKRVDWKPFTRVFRLNGGLHLELGSRTLIMGILNVTPDSFSDGGLYTSVDAAVERAAAMVEEGADIIDVGGESTRPGHVPVPAEAELERVIPVIRELRRVLPHVPISIDTYKAQVAREAVKAGAHIINDVWGTLADEEMAAAAAELDCPIVLMHNRKEAVYRDLVREVCEDLRTCVRRAQAAGVRTENIILDPGIGFGKTYEHNLQLMGRLYEVVEMGYPVLLGTSRKSMIRTTLGLPADDVVEGTAATVAFGIAQGCQIMRVHDVKAIRRTARMMDALVYAERT